MERLVICGKVRTGSPEENFCGSQSALDFMTCTNNRAANEDSSAARSKCKQPGKVTKDRIFSKQNGCHTPNSLDRYEASSGQEVNRSLSERRKTLVKEGGVQPSTPSSKSGRIPVSASNTETSHGKSKAKPEEITCWTGIFDDDDDEDNTDCENDKENDYLSLDNLDYNLTSCASKRKKRVTVDEPIISRNAIEKDLSNITAGAQAGKPSAEHGDEKICYVSDLAEHFAVVRKIGSGTFGSVFLAVRRRDQLKVALKKLPKDKTKIEDFCLEFRYGRQFSRHPCILETASMAFVTRSWYVLVHEYAPMSDLLRSVPPRVGLPEVAVKSVVRQVAGAVGYIHSKQVVHRDLKLENILVFQDQGTDRMLTRVKLGDFGVARRVGTMVCKVCDGTTYTPPEICSLARHSYYRVDRSADVWSLGVVIFCLMTGSFPWQLADLTLDPLFQSFARWQAKRAGPIPEHWVRFSPTLRSLFHKFLEVRPIKRCDVTILPQYLDQAWSTGSNGESNGQLVAAGSSCNASGSGSTLTCAPSTRPPSSYSGSSLSSAHFSNHSQHVNTPHSHSHAQSCAHHKHHNQQHTTNAKQSEQLYHHHPGSQQQDSDQVTGDRQQPCHGSAATLDGIYKDSPLKTSGALHSPLLGKDANDESAIFCGRRPNSKAQEVDGACAQEELGHHSSRGTSIRRCHHHHHNNFCEKGTGGNHHKCSCRRHKHLSRASTTAGQSAEVSTSSQSNSASNDTDPETILRLDRVNRWIMNHMA